MDDCGRIPWVSLDTRRSIVVVVGGVTIPGVTVGRERLLDRLENRRGWRDRLLGFRRFRGRRV
ncbi:hypothetical protein [Maritimibacter sp. HL-12]|uniref:hypothetical protein n=1 Tax=Maritimibacter sp. HL-12 TaxID=1162418 RepID=UPI000A0F1598|nr:hypothetical protein [Maritimibacter sp. HL-12]SMH51262.1 hypothetical protein SAMN05661107_2464 [Maritimibacter sp. HL-12]